MRGQQCGPDVRNRSHQYGGVVTRWDESLTLPIAFGLRIDRADDDGSTANDVRTRDAPAKGVGDKHRANPPALMTPVDCQLPDQQTRNRIGQPTCADAARRSTCVDRTWRKAVIANDLPILMDRHNARKAVTLIGVCKRLEPAIKCGLAAFNSFEIMRI